MVCLSLIVSIAEDAFLNDSTCGTSMMRHFFQSAVQMAPSLIEEWWYQHRTRAGKWIDNGAFADYACAFIYCFTRSGPDNPLPMIQPSDT